MIKQLLNSVIAKYWDLSVSGRSIISLSLRLRQIIDLAADKSRYFAQPRSIIVQYSSIPFLHNNKDLTGRSIVKMAQLAGYNLHGDYHLHP